MERLCRVRFGQRQADALMEWRDAAREKAAAAFLAARFNARTPSTVAIASSKARRASATRCKAM